MPTKPDPTVLATRIADALTRADTDGLETLVEQYRAATAPKRRGTTPMRNFRCDDDLWERVADEADREKTNPADVLRRLIADHLPPRAEIAR